MLFRSIVPSPKGALLPHQLLLLTNVYLENAFKANDYEVALMLGHDAEAILYQSKGATKRSSSTPTDVEDQSLREIFGAAYFNLGKLLENHGHHDEARAFYKKSEKYGGPVLGTDQLTQRSRSGSIAPTSTAAISTLNPSLPSVSQLKHRSDIATLPLHIFARNARPPAMPFNPPEPDTRLNDTPQLACCLGLLRDALNPDDILDPATRNWFQLTTADTDEQERLKALATDVIRAFKRDELKDAKAVAEVAYLAPVLEKDDFRYLVKEFHSGIEQSALLDIHQLEGLAQLLQGADPGYLEADDLVKVLELLNTRLIDTHHQSPHLAYKLTLAVSHVLDAMVDAEVKDLDREKLHEPLSKYLDALKASSDSYLVYQAAYAYQALLCVPDNETAWQAAMRRTGKVIKGVSGLVSAVKGLDLNGFMEGLKDIQQGLAGAAGVTRLVKATYNGVTSLNKSGQIFMDCLKEGLSFSRKCSWYPALRGADALIRDGQLAKLRKLICEAPCRRDPAFQWGICQRLGDIASNPMWDAEMRRSAIAFLGEIYQNDAAWGDQPTVKQWVLNILMQLSSFHLDDMQYAETLLQELRVKGDTSKQSLYRACQEEGPGSHPFKVALPALGSPSLLDRVQNRLDVEGNLRLLRRQRFKERGSAVYIPPQAKASIQAPDSARFPLMETVKEFVVNDQQRVFLVLGESGSGKSTFNREFEYELWQAYKKKTGAIPLNINLPSIDKPEHDMIAKQLRKAEFTEPQIRELKLHRKFILVCDGYDESQQTHNLYTSNRFNQPGEWNAKMVISCRSEYLGVDYRDRFQPVDRNYRAEGALFQEAVMTPFAMNQVHEYIDQYVTLHQPLWEAKDYKEALDRIPSLKELVKNPFLMSLSLEVLPRMVDPGQDGSIAGITNITRGALYDQFIRHWLERGKKRLGEKNLTPQARVAFESLIDEGFTQCGIEYLKDLCVAIYKEQDGQPIVRYSRKKDEGTWKEEFFGRDDEKQLLREACPLTRSGNQHRFIHRSLLEYALSLAMFEPQDTKATVAPEPRPARRGSVDSDLSSDSHEDMHDSTPSTLKPDPKSPLAWRLFVNEPSVLQFLEERVQQDPMLLRLLFEYIELSKTDKMWRKAAANAITILVRVGAQFNHAQLTGIQIPGADLSYGSFESAQLQGADLRNVNLRGTWMLQADLSKAQMTGVQFGELPYLEQESWVKCTTYSPDGKSFAIGLGCGKINVYSTTTWVKLWASSDHADVLSSISYSPRCDLIVTGSEDMTVRIWDAESGACRHTLTGHGDRINCVVYSPHSDVIASASEDNTIRLWDPVTGESKTTLSGHDTGVLSIVFSPIDNQIASLGRDSVVHLWDVNSKMCTHVLSGHEDVVRSIMYSPQGGQIVSISDDNTLRLWDTETGECVHVLRGHTEYICSVTYSPRGDQVASASGDETARIWDVKTGLCRHTLSGHGSCVTGIAYSPRSDQLASASYDSTVRLWDLETGTCLQTLSGHTATVTSVLYSPNGDQIASCSSDRTVRLWDVKSRASRHISSDHSAPVTVVKFSPSGNQAASCSEDGTIRLWDVERGSCLRTLMGHRGEVNCVAYAWKGEQIASVGDDCTVRLWDTKTGKCSKTLTGHTKRLMNVAYSPRGNQIATCGEDATVRLWDVEAGRCTHTLIGHSSDVCVAVYSPYGVQLASGSLDGTVRLWDGATGRCLHVLSSHTGEIYSIAYSPSGDQLASASKDTTIRLWDVQAGSCRGVLKGHTDIVHRVAYSPVRDQIATASFDHTVRLWNANLGYSTRVLTNHTENVYRVLYSPLGDMVASTSADSSLRLWDVATGECQAVAEGDHRFTSIDWHISDNANYLIAGCEDGSVKMWQVTQSGGQCELRICRRGTKGGLNIKHTSIQEVRGLSEYNRRLLEQRGAVGVPVHSSQKADKMAIGWRRWYSTTGR